MTEISGTISSITFYSEDSHYCVFSAVSDEDRKTYTLVGTAPGAAVGMPFTARVREKVHEIYGKQLALETFSPGQPKTLDSMELYLGSGIFKGVGPGLAARIVKKFGDETMLVLSERPEELEKVRGISAKKALEISAMFNEKRASQQAVMFLQDLGITVGMAGRIFSKYGEEMYEILRQNPYRLAEDVDGIGFQRCDQIAEKLGIAKDSESRIEAGIHYALIEGEQLGNCYLPQTLLQTSAEELLKCRIEDLRPYLLDLQMRNQIVVKGDRVYDAYLYRAERKTAEQLAKLNRFSHSELDMGTERRIDEITEDEGITLDPLQRRAVSYAYSSGLLVITGGPGTGKTTTIRTIISLFKKEKQTILLAAPTGRAAKRMSEATGTEAKTIHRLLEYQGRAEDGDDVARLKDGQFMRNTENPLEGDVIIIDEMSMVDINLMSALLSAVAPGTRLILVGDANQLPSVGAGNVLRDIIASGTVRTVELKHIFRQAAESDIVMNAHRINAGEEVDLAKRSRDFIFIRAGSPREVIKALCSLVTDKLPGYLKIPAGEIQVMTPLKKGSLGVEALNTVLQEKLNPSAPGKPEQELNGTRYRLGDKVMQMKNDYNLEWEIRGDFGMPVERGMGVFNGDIGTIREINRLTRIITVQYDDRFVNYDFSATDSLALAYAITIHKSQGSEYPAVVIPMFHGPKLLMNRNLLYTAVTRAKRMVLFVGDPQAFEEMLHNNFENKRFSGLAEAIRECGEDRS